MAGTLLNGARSKIQWGRDAIAKIHSELTDALSGDRLMVVEESDPATGDRLLMVKLKSPLPSEVQHQIANAAHHLRSSLDASAIALARTAKLPKYDHIYFPFGKDAAAFAKESKQKLRDIDPAAVKIIEGFKPYHGGNDVLWGLHRLDIADKHYDVIPMGSSGNVNLVQDLEIKNAKVGVILGAGGRMDQGFAISNLGQHGTFNGRGNLASGVPNLGVQCDAVFGEVEVFAGQSIYGTLQRAERAVTEIVEALEPFCA